VREYFVRLLGGDFMLSIHKKNGFSLIELMIAVAIIAILTAIAIPSYLGIKKKSARAEAKSNLKTIAMCLENYYAENDDYGGVGVYTYVLDNAGQVVGTFNFPGIPDATFGLGNNLNYDYTIRVTGTNTYTLTAQPQRGPVVNDLTPTLDSVGIKGPTGFGW